MCHYYVGAWVDDCMSAHTVCVRARDLEKPAGNNRLIEGAEEPMYLCGESTRARACERVRVREYRVCARACRCNCLFVWGTQV